MEELEDIAPDNSQDFGNDFGGDFYGGGGGDAPIFKHSDLLKDLTNFDPLVQKRIKNWLGLEWDDKVRNYRKYKNLATINEKGAKWAIGFLQTYQNKPNLLTNISRDEFKNLHLNILKVVWRVFPTIDEFEVKGTADWYRLCSELEDSAFLVLAGAGDGKYTKFFGDSVSRHENVSLSPQQVNNRGSNRGVLGTIKDKLLGRG